MAGKGPGNSARNLRRSRTVRHAKEYVWRREDRERCVGGVEGASGQNNEERASPTPAPHPPAVAVPAWARARGGKKAQKTKQKRRVAVSWPNRKSITITKLKRERVVGGGDERNTRGRRRDE